MDAEIQRLQSELASAEAEIHRLGKAVHDLESLFAGKTQTPIRVPSGVDGINFTYEVMAQQIGAEEAAAEAEATFSHPFKITTETVGGVPKYKVAKGSIQDGTNGTTIALTGITETDRAATAGYVVLEADVDAGLVVSGWALAIKTAAADTQEVGMTASGEIRQNKLRMLIGKLTVDGAVATPWQAWFTSARVGTGLLNGVAVRLIDAAPTLATEI